MSATASLRWREDRLFMAWRRHWASCGRREPFLPDGAQADYDKQPVKLLFLLKEGNDPDFEYVYENGGDLRELEPNARGYTWNNLARWAAAVTECGLEWPDVKSLAPDDRRKFIRRTALVNVKKTPGSAVAERQAVLEAALRDRAFLLRQISLYRPHITLCCGTFHVAERLLGLRPSDAAKSDILGAHALWYHEDGRVGLLLDFWHPQARDDASWLFGTLRMNVKAHGIASLNTVNRN